jgi:hypothetical protein
MSHTPPMLQYLSAAAVVESMAESAPDELASILHTTEAGRRAGDAFVDSSDNVKGMVEAVAEYSAAFGETVAYLQHAFSDEDVDFRSVSFSYIAEAWLAACAVFEEAKLRFPTTAYANVERNMGDPFAKAMSFGLHNVTEEDIATWKECCDDVQARVAPARRLAEATMKHGLGHPEVNKAMADYQAAVA